MPPFPREFKHAFPKLPCDNCLMIACLDVAYHGLEANAAAVLFHSWDDSNGQREIVTRFSTPADYRPKSLKRRHLVMHLDPVKNKTFFSRRVTQLNPDSKPCF